MSYSGGMLDREEMEEEYDEKNGMMTPLATEQQPHVRLKERIRELRVFQVAALVLFIAAIVFLVLFVQQTGSPATKKTEKDDDVVEQTMYASCVLVGGGGVSGVVTMWQTKRTEDITVEVTVAGLEPGEHGFHIHELGSLDGGCGSSGSHYNPFGKNHGAPYDEDRHVGDLGNIVANEEGVAVATITDRLVKLSGETSVIGRAIVVHADRDDLGRGGFPDSLTTGHAGARVACGVIGIAAAQI